MRDARRVTRAAHQVLGVHSEYEMLLHGPRVDFILEPPLCSFHFHPSASFALPDSPNFYEGNLNGEFEEFISQIKNSYEANYNKSFDIPHRAV